MAEPVGFCLEAGFALVLLKDLIHAPETGSADVQAVLRGSQVIGKADSWRPLELHGSLALDGIDVHAWYS
ncbi:MAG: hypothetical protein HS115_11600 [Spirochaetales bacterium]|nr:hypothetical protein [Spirochaetales bacterium]